MILEMKNGGISILKDSLERTDKVNIRLIFRDLNITNRDVVKIYIDKTELKKIDTNLYQFDFSTVRRGENNLRVFVYQNDLTRTYEKRLTVRSYISFDELGHDKFPQIILDINENIKRLEDKYKEIENKINVI